VQSVVISTSPLSNAQQGVSRRTVGLRPVHE